MRRTNESCCNEGSVVVGLDICPVTNSPKQHVKLTMSAVYLGV